MGDVIDGGFDNQRETARRKVSELLEGIESPTNPVTVTGDGNIVVTGQLTIVYPDPATPKAGRSVKDRLRSIVDRFICPST